MQLTCEHRRLQQLHELVDLDEGVDSHLEVGTVSVSWELRIQEWCERTRLEVTDMLARMLGQEDIAKK